MGCKYKRNYLSKHHGFHNLILSTFATFSRWYNKQLLQLPGPINSINKTNHEISFWCQFFIHHLLKRKPFSYVIHILWPHQFGNTLLCALSVYWLDHMRQKTEFIWIQWKNLRKNWNKLISLRWVCASQIAQEDYISFFFFVPHLNVSASPKLIRWPRAHILIAYTGWIYLRDAANSDP